MTKDKLTSFEISVALMRLSKHIEDFSLQSFGPHNCYHVVLNSSITTEPDFKVKEKLYYGALIVVSSDEKTVFEFTKEASVYLKQNLGKNSGLRFTYNKFKKSENVSL
ncbi:MAG: hypothetical protein NWF06_01865 [Candidatus Bathyarchaeota archaeon]|nr:hypothetical protein [Candidatus Bathyarchaeum sp.]